MIRINWPLFFRIINIHRWKNHFDFLVRICALATNGHLIELTAFILKINWLWILAFAKRWYYLFKSEPSSKFASRLPAICVGFSSDVSDGTTTFAIGLAFWSSKLLSVTSVWGKLRPYLRFRWYKNDRPVLQFIFALTVCSRWYFIFIVGES